jgi:hypothetical protein
LFLLSSQLCLFLSSLFLLSSQLGLLLLSSQLSLFLLLLSSQLGLFLLPTQLGLFLALRGLPEVCPVDWLMFLPREGSWLFPDWLSLGKCRGQN